MSQSLVFNWRSPRVVKPFRTAISENIETKIDLLLLSLQKREVTFGTNTYLIAKEPHAIEVAGAVWGVFFVNLKSKNCSFARHAPFLSNVGA